MKHFSFRLLCRLVFAAVIVFSAFTTTNAAPAPLARWTFEGDALDQVGGMHGTLIGGAFVTERGLVLNGNDAYVLTAPLPVDVAAKTLIATVRLDSLEQGGGGALTLESVDGLTFDSIVFGERQQGKWMAGSDEFRRTMDLPATPETNPNIVVHLAIVNDSDGTIVMYRNGILYGTSYTPSSSPQTYLAGSGRVLLGLRHSPEASGKFFQGEIKEAELYAQALTPAEIAELADAVEDHQPVPEPSIARVWSEEILNAIRIDLPHPPVHARNLFSLSAAMYDAWAAYDPVAVGFAYRLKHTSNDIAASRREAISYAAYRLLRERYSLSQQSETTLAALDQRLLALGYDPAFVTLNPSTPAGLGNLVAAAVSAWFGGDGSRQGQRYEDISPDSGGYNASNGYLELTTREPAICRTPTTGSLSTSPQ